MTERAVRPRGSTKNRKRRDIGLVGEPAASALRNRRLVRREFNASLMSDTKWRKLFLAVERYKLALPVCRIKWIDSEKPCVFATPTSKFLYPPRPFIVAHEFG